jgi:chemotaxis protein MotB
MGPQPKDKPSGRAWRAVAPNGDQVRLDMAGGQQQAPTIIKKIKKGGHGGHHGGAWKVAYADFVTAMMAFFLLMWLINTTTPEQKRGIADYFAPEAVSRSNSGNGAVLSGTAPAENGVDGSGQLAAKTALRPPNTASEDAATADARDPSADAANGDTGSDAALERAAIRLRQAMQDMPDFAKLSRHIIIDTTPEGARVQLIDQDGRSMFEPGSAEPTAEVRTLLEEVGKVVDEFPNRISISGHTDGGSFTGPGGYTNWDLSSARANATLRILQEAGLKDGRVAEVVGKAGADPLYPENPHASANRRVSIILLKEAPVLPPNL